MTSFDFHAVTNSASILCDPSPCDHDEEQEKPTAYSDLRLRFPSAKLNDFSLSYQGSYASPETFLDSRLNTLPQYLVVDKPATVNQMFTGHFICINDTHVFDRGVLMDQLRGVPEFDTAYHEAFNHAATLPDCPDFDRFVVSSDLETDPTTVEGSAMLQALRDVHAMRYGFRVPRIEPDDFWIEKLLDPDADISYLEQDEFEDRREEYVREEFHFIGIRAAVEIDGKEYTSAGLWGIESDSDKEYLAGVAQEEVDDLKDILIKESLNVSLPDVADFEIRSDH